MKIIVITRPAFFKGETDIVNELFRTGLERLHLRKPGATEPQLAEWLQGIEPEYLSRIVLHDCHDLAKSFPIGGVHLNSRNPEVPAFLDSASLPSECAGRLAVSRACPEGHRSSPHQDTKQTSALRAYPDVHRSCQHPDIRQLSEPSSCPHSDDRQITVSRSCHSIAEVQKYKDSCNYLFLSPIYDSISKEGYGAAFSRTDLKRAADEGIIDKKVYALGGVSAEHLPELQELGFGGAAVLGALWQSASPTAYLRSLLQLCQR